ncbi:MAG: hypothetical protein JWS12_275 [Candidatus Saccharibacteria bacterium]|nr:hypothetical protein [Candidatus Saccharibacteria bacterium]
MPKANRTKKTAWAPKLIAAGLVLAGLVAGYSGLHYQRSHRCYYLQSNAGCVALTTAKSPAARAKGLGQRDNLPANHGMLFVFDQPAQQCFWMKDMRFSLDIIWMDANKRVVHIEPHVSPATFPKTFCPSQPAQYVIELNSGAASQLGINLDQSLNF